MTERIYEGPWEEVAEHAPEFSGRRVRLVVLADEPAATNGDQQPKEDQSLAEAFAGRVGRLSFDPSDLSERTGEAFTDIVSEKHREGRL